MLLSPQTGRWRKQDESAGQARPEVHPRRRDGDDRHPFRMKTLIIADDLSGAADCAVAFARGEAVVLLAEPATELPCEVLAIDADTRAGSVVQAAAVTAGLFSRHAKPGVTLFKKFDSTLRGHVAAEIAAALAALRARSPIAIVTPCHRVIAKNGELKGYAGGVHRKKWLLEHEHALPAPPAKAEAPMAQLPGF